MVGVCVRTEADLLPEGLVSLVLDVTSHLFVLISYYFFYLICITFLALVLASEFLREFQVGDVLLVGLAQGHAFGAG